MFIDAISDRTEINFVHKKPNGKRHYYQVAQSLTDDKVYKREIEPLLQISDNSPKTILALDVYRTDITKEDITIVGITD